MADDKGIQIDKLSLDIKVKVGRSEKKINSVSQAIDNLTKSLKGLEDVNKQMQQLQEMFDSLNKSLRVTNKVTQSAKDIGKVFKSSLKTEELHKTTESENNLNKVIAKRITLLKNVSKVTKPNVDELGKLDPSTKKPTNSFTEFFKSLRRIANYRLIRTVLSGLTNTISKGLNNLRTENEQLDNSLKSISASFTSIGNSLASVLAPMLQTIAPILTGISDTIAKFMNITNETQAVMNGQDKYTKILTSDTEEYQKQLEKTTGSLLKFDTFTTLANKSGYTGVVTEDITMNIEEANKQLNKFYGLIGVITVAMGVLAFVSPFGKIAFAIGAVIGAIVLLKHYWGDIVNFFETTIRKISEFFNNLGKGISNLWNNFRNSKWFTFLFGEDIRGRTVGVSPVGVGSGKAFATGGSFNTGDYFVANENGSTELIASTNNGGAVMNMEQLQSAIYNGMIMAMADSGGGEIVLKVDQNTLGRIVANNKVFASEINRRNKNINLL